LRIWEKWGKVKKKKKIVDAFCQNMTTALQTCYNINADWHTFFLEAIAFLGEGNFLQRTFITMGGCHHVLTITTLSNSNRF
jgi:hypothetical protein